MEPRAMDAPSMTQALLITLTLTLKLLRRQKEEHQSASGDSSPD